MITRSDEPVTAWCRLAAVLLLAGAASVSAEVNRDPLSAFLTAPPRTVAAGRVDVARLDTDLVPSPVPVAVLLPPGYDPEAEPYPLLLLLHGGGGNHRFLSKRLRATLERAWASGVLAPAVVATPAAGRSFYLDYRDGSQRWERFILEALLPHLRRTYNVTADRAGTLISGISMGGMGSLRLAFKHPEVFAAVAALEPGIEPVLAFDDIAPEDRFWRSPALFEERYGKPVDRAYWEANNPANIVREQAARIRDSGLLIYLEVGDEDSFNLHRGTEFLHRILFDHGISHGYRLLDGADHLGATLTARFLYAFAALNQALQPPPPDRSLRALHRRIDAMKAAAGLTP